MPLRQISYLTSLGLALVYYKMDVLSVGAHSVHDQQSTHAVQLPNPTETVSVSYFCERMALLNLTRVGSEQAY